MSETTEEIVIPKETLKGITDVVSKDVQESLDKSIDEKLEKAVEEGSKKVIDKYLEEHESAIQKGVKEAEAKKQAELEANDPIAKGLAEKKFSKEIADMSAAKRFYLAQKYLEEENLEALKELNAYAVATQIKARMAVEKEGGDAAVAKTGYANSTTAADGAVLIPDAEFVTTVFDNLPKYGVAFRYADVRQTDRTAVRVISLDSGLRFYRTAEAGVKTGAKLAFSKNEVSLLKYAVIVPAADEFTDDAAIDYWNVVTQELTRAYARLADEITFTDTTSGITNLSGVVTEPVSGAGTTINWDDLLQAESHVEDDVDTSNFNWFMRKETWFRLIQLKGTTNDHYIAGSLVAGWSPNPNQPTTPWGTPVVFTRVLPSSGPTLSADGQNVVATNDAFAVYGDLKNYLLYNKRGMAIKILEEAIVKDSENSDFNLATQDATAMRAVVRLLGICPKGNRGKFVVLGTGTVS